jgi:orotate phosphoribosyltransferase
LVDSRGAGSNLRLRNVVVAALAEKFLPLDDVTTVVGLAKSGMTWGAWLAQSTGLPYATVLLDGPRPGGLQREIEGDVHGRRVALVDNWVSSGESLQQASSVVERHGGHVSAAIAVCGRVSSNLPFPVLLAFRLPHLLTAAAEGQLISAEELKLFLTNEN